MIDIRLSFISCDARREVFGDTRFSLYESDWPQEEGALPYFVTYDYEACDLDQVTDKRQRQVKASFLAIERFLKSRAEYLLFCEDDIEFDKQIWAKLQAWEPLKQAYLGFGSLYNPNINMAAYTDEHTSIADPNAVYGSQAMIMSKAVAQYIWAHWNSWHEHEGGEAMQDIRMSRLAAFGLKQQIYYHIPSLVEHRSVPSVWGGTEHKSIDFGQKVEV